jgi:Cu(I)/Ag(I) efflux system membrane fusion protein
MNTFLHNAWTVTKVALARLRFLAVFVIAGLVVGYWDDIRNHVDKWTRPAVLGDSLAAAHEVEWYCAMHPNVVRDEPGTCPICSMPLIKRKKGEQQVLPADVLARVQLSPQRVAMAGIGTSLVERRELSRDFDAVGVVDYNEAGLAQLAARVSGRVDQLMLRSVGQEVKRGQVVYLLYSPEVYTAIRDYLLARKRVNESRSAPKTDLMTDASEVYNASMQKLLLWGISREQLDAMDAQFDKDGSIATHLQIASPIDGIVVEKNILEGAYLETGSTPFTIADLSTVWLNVKLFEADIPLVHVGQRATVSVEAMPGDTFTGTVSYMDFKLDPQTRTLKARIEVKNPGLRLRPGMFASAHFELPIVPQATKATTRESATYAATYALALARYLEAQQKLTQDSAEGVALKLREAADLLAPLKDDPKLASSVERYEAAVDASMGKDMEGLRNAFKEVSMAFIEIGKQARIPSDSPSISVYRCPMAKANWLQVVGPVRNPYYGTEMIDCGGPVEALPRAEVVTASAATRPVTRVQAVPRSAVINTGKRMIVYVQSGPGVYDMRQIQAGPLAGEWYPVFGGLQEGEQVVTQGAFLVDAENRLNPSAAVPEK